MSDISPAEPTAETPAQLEPAAPVEAEAALLADPSPSAARFMTIAVLMEGGLAVLALGIGWLLGFDPWYGLNRDYDMIAFSRDVLWGVAATAPAVLVLMIEETAWQPLADLKVQVHELLQRLLQGARLWQLLVIALAAGWGEELLFRGLLQAGIAAILPGIAGLVASVLIASILFGLCHYLSQTYFLLATLAGCYFGLVMLITGSLLPAIIAHALYDFIALAYLLEDE